MHRTYGWVAAAVMIGGFAAGATAADAEAQAVFDSLFKRKVETVAKTPQAADDIQLAGELLDAAKAAATQPGLVEVMCEQAYALASRDAAGHDKAVAAMRLMGQTVAPRAAEALERIAALQQKQLNAARGKDRLTAGEPLIDTLVALAERRMADGNSAEAVAGYRRAQTVATSINSAKRGDVQKVLDALDRRQKLDAQRQQLTDKLNASPGDKATTLALAKLLTLQFDDPAEALKAAEQSGDEAWIAHLRLAAGDPASLTEADALTLGDWYRTLSDEADTAGRPLMLTRAHRYYGSYLDRHTAADLGRTKAELAQRAVDDALAKLGVNTAAIRPLATAAPDKPAPAPAPHPARTSGPTGEIVIEAAVDGHSILHVGRDRLWWEHLQAKKPGIPDGDGSYILVNGQRWTLKWKKAGAGGSVAVSEDYSFHAGDLNLRAEVISIIDAKGTPVKLGAGRTFAMTNGTDEKLITINDRASGASIYKFRLTRAAAGGRPEAAGEAGGNPNKLFEALRAPPDMRQKPGDAEGPPWMDLMPAFDVANARAGQWRMDGGKLVTNPSGENVSIRVPADLTPPYEIRCRAAATKGGVRVWLTTPEHAAIVIVANEAIGLDSIDKLGYAKSPTYRRGKFLSADDPRELLARVRTTGDQATVEVFLEGQKLIGWTGPVASWVKSTAEQGVLRIGGFGERVEWSEVKVRRLQ